MRSEGAAGFACFDAGIDALASPLLLEAAAMNCTRSSSSSTSGSSSGGAASVLVVLPFLRLTVGVDGPLELPLINPRSVSSTGAKGGGDTGLELEDTGSSSASSASDRELNLELLALDGLEVLVCLRGVTSTSLGSIDVREEEEAAEGDKGSEYRTPSARDRSGSAER